MEDEIIELLSQIGQLLVANGMETFYVEKTVEDYSKELGVPVICSVSLTTITLSKVEGIATKVVKNQFIGYNLQVSDDISHYYYQLRNKEISIEKFFYLVKNAEKNIKEYPLRLQLLGAGIISLPPSVVGVVQLRDFFLMMFVGALGFYTYKRTKQWKATSYVGYFIGGLIIGIADYLLYKLLNDVNFFILVLGSVMPLVPGLAITNSIREIINGDFISGSVRMMQTILIILSLTVGVGGGQELVDLVI